MKVCNFCLLLQSRVSRWKNAKQKQTGQYKKQSRKMIFPEFRVGAFCNIQGRCKHDKKALFKVRKKIVEKQSVRVQLGS